MSHDQNSLSETARPSGPRTVAITGVGGFIGLAVARAARARGDRVVGLELSPEAAARARAAGVEVIEGNLTSVAACRQLVRDADVVVHTAAVVAEDGDPALFEQVNVTAPAHLAAAASEAGVRELVHLSSVMVYGFSYPPDVTEEGPLRGEGNPYCATKARSEVAVREALQAAGDRTRLTVVRPGDVYGPGSVPWVVRPLELMRRRLFVLPDGGRGTINHVHVDNLVDGILLAADRAPGTPDTYNLTDGVATSWAAYFNELNGWVRGPGARLPSAPSSLLLPAFRALEIGSGLLGVEPPARPAALRFISRMHPVSIDRARRHLGYAPAVSLADGLARTHAWARSAGLVP